jgi:hypothetical protein
MFVNVSKPIVPDFDILDEVEEFPGLATDVSAASLRLGLLRRTRFLHLPYMRPMRMNIAKPNQIY